MYIFIDFHYEAPHSSVRKKGREREKKRKKKRRRKIGRDLGAKVKVHRVGMYRLVHQFHVGFADR